MRRSGVQTCLLDAIGQFQAEMQRLAYAAVQAVIEQELARRRAQPELPKRARPEARARPERARSERRARPERARPARRKRESPQVRQLELGFSQPQPQLELPLAADTADRAPR